jgi:hypothetical protein
MKGRETVSKQGKMTERLGKGLEMKVTGTMKEKPKGLKI